MRGYKGFDFTNGELKCNGVTYTPNEEFTHDGDIELCRSGIHFCEKLEDVFRHYPYSTRRKYFIVEATGNVVKGNGKCVTDKIRLVEECTVDAYFKAIAIKFKELCDCDPKTVEELMNIPSTRKIYESDLIKLIDRDGCIIRFFEPFEREPLILAAVQQNGAALYHLLKEERTPEVCIAAVTQNPIAVVHLDEDEWSKEIIELTKKNTFARAYVEKVIRK